MRRHPLLVSVVGLAAIVAAYLWTSKPLVALAEDVYFAQFERRLVVDRSALLRAGNKRLFGMYRPELPWDYSRFFTIGQTLGVVPQVVSFYQAWGAGPAHEFKPDAVSQALERGLIPLITWEPWLSAFGQRSIVEPTGCIKFILAGNFDDYIRDWARASVRVRKPFFLRPLHEIGNAEYFWSTKYDNSPKDLAEAYRHIVRIFRNEGAKNVAFVWTPHLDEDLAAWPGPQWVDIVGLDLFNYGTLVPGGRWQSLEELLSTRLKTFGNLGRPVMIAEVGCSGRGGNCRDFWIEALKTLEGHRRSEVRAFVVYDHPAYPVHGGKDAIDWGFSHQSDILPAMAYWIRKNRPGSSFQVIER